LDHQGTGTTPLHAHGQLLFVVLNFIAVNPTMLSAKA
jgi:hypothetical protein